jgi:general secretion pathway protein L
VSEIRFYLRRDSFLDGMDCAWALLDDAGRIQTSGTRLEDLPRASRCRLVLASDLVLTVRASLPDLPERRLAALLPAAAEAATLVDADAIHAVLLERGVDGTAVLAVVEEAWLGRILSRLAEQGIHPDAALPEYLLLPWTPGVWSVGWRVDNTLARFGAAQGMALDDGEPPVGLSLALAQGGRPEVVKVYQCDNLGAPDWTRWRAALDTTVEAAGAWDWRTAPWPELPGLLQGRHSPNRNRLDWKRPARPLVWGVIALAGIQFFGLALDWAMLARESASVKQEMRVLAERALPAHAAVVDPPWQVTERLRSLHAATGNPESNALMGLLGQLGQAWPADGGALVQTLSYEAGALVVSVAGADGAWLDQLKTAAAARGLAIDGQEDPGKGVRFGVRPAGKGDRHAQ